MVVYIPSGCAMENGQKICEVAAVVVQAGADGGLDEGSDIADRERWINLKCIWEIKLMIWYLIGWGRVGRNKHLKDGVLASGAPQPT